jgi:cobalt-zinc-cadmium efflux system outer membrane protein
VFNRNQGGKARADADIERAAWQYLAVKQRIAQETQEAFDQQTQARAALAQWRNQVIPQAEANARLAERVFAQGDQSYLFVLDAARRLVDVRQRELELWSDTQRAAIQLDRALGRKLDAKP